MEFWDYLTILTFLSEGEENCLVWLLLCCIFSCHDLHTRQNLNLFCKTSTSESCWFRKGKVVVEQLVAVLFWEI